MIDIKNLLMSQIMFWMAWIIIPLIMEIIPAIGDYIVLLKRRWSAKNQKEITYYPNVTVIVPVYNSEGTLRGCIQSIYESDYPKDKLDVMLVNNKTKDNSFEIFCECQKEYSELKMNWMNAQQGKSKALNLALFNSNGKYIIHIDSDGKLDNKAIRKIVNKFENEEDVHAITGTVITDPKLIEKTKNPFLKLLQKMEFGEYCHSCLAGRSFQTEFNAVFTLAGAFSAFRKSAILSTQLYNTDTVCEDAHLTFQLREVLGKRVALCNDAIFYIDPFESMGKLNTQRQRWQSGEIEVLHMFRKKKLNPVKGFASDFVMRMLIYDHTFAFPRMIWYFALICLAMINYPIKLVVMAMIFMYVLYSVSNLLMYFCIIAFLKEFDDLRSYYARKWYLIFLLPAFNFIVFWFRIAGFVNSGTGRQAWRTRTAKEDWHEFAVVFESDFQRVNKVVLKIRDEVNVDEE